MNQLQPSRTVRRINNSEIQEFKRCRRKWYLSYYKGLVLPSESEKSALFLGTLVHAALENYYLKKDPFEPIQAEIDKLQNLDALTDPDNAVVVPMDRYKDVELARIMVEGYLEWLEESAADMGLEIVGVEEELEASLGIVRGREIILHGRLDARVHVADGSKLFLDHKTVQNFGDLTDRRLQLNEQLMTYAMLLRMVKDETVDGAMLNMLRKVKRTSNAKPPFYQRETARFNVEQLRSHFQHTLAVVDDILALEAKLDADPVLGNAAAYPTVDKDCTWKCPFLSVCPMVDDGSDIEGALSGLYALKNAS